MSSRSRTPTRRGRPTRCAGSSRFSPTPMSRTSAGACARGTRRGSNRGEPLLALRALAAGAESRLGSVTGGNGSIYALKRRDYVEVDPRWGTISPSYRVVQAGRRAVYEPAALAFEKPTPPNEAEYSRKVRMFDTAGRSRFGARCCGAAGRLPRLGRIAPPAALRKRAPAPRAAGDEPRLAPSAGRMRWRCSASSRCSRPSRPGSRSRRYYVYVTWAAVQALWNYPARRGVLPRGTRPKAPGEPCRGRRARGSRPRPGQPARPGPRSPIQARGRRPGPLPAAPGREGRKGLRAAEAPLDGRRRRPQRGRARGRSWRFAHHEGRPPSCEGRRSTSCRSSGTSSAATCR